MKAVVEYKNTDISKEVEVFCKNNVKF